MAQRQKESQDTLAVVRSQLSSKRTVGELIMDTLPFVISIVQPPVKPVRFKSKLVIITSHQMNEQLYSKKDREIINDAVAIMHGFSLTYSPTMVNTQVHFVFQPLVSLYY